MEFYIYVDKGRVKDIEIYSDAMEQNFSLAFNELVTNCVYITRHKSEGIEKINGEKIMSKDLITLIQDDL